MREGLLRHRDLDCVRRYARGLLTRIRRYFARIAAGGRRADVPLVAAWRSQGNLEAAQLLYLTRISAFRKKS